MIDTLQKTVIEYMKAGKREEAQIVRDMVAELKNKEIELQRPLTDAEAVTVMRKQVKKLEDAVEQFEEGGRDDLAEENREEIVLLRSFMPAEISDEEVEKRVRAVVEKNEGLDRGRLIGAAIKELGSEIDSSRIAKAVNSILSK